MPRVLIACVNFARLLLCYEVFKIFVGVGHLTRSMSERLEALDVAKECVSWLETAFGDVITVAPNDEIVCCVLMKYTITHNDGNPRNPIVLVGACDSSKLCLDHRLPTFCYAVAFQSGRWPIHPCVSARAGCFGRLP